MSCEVGGECNCPVSKMLNEEFTLRFQEVIFWRRPIVLILIGAIVEAVFWGIKKMELTTFSTILFMIFLYHVTKLIWHFFAGAIRSFLFKELPELGIDEPNRTRSLSEVRRNLAHVKAKKMQIQEWLVNYMAEPTLVNTLLFVGTSFLLFSVFSYFGTYKILCVLVHAILIVPGLIVNPTVRKFVAEKLNQEPKEKTE